MESVGMSPAVWMPTGIKGLLRRAIPQVWLI
jgi:hypothetical protein